MSRNRHLLLAAALIVLGLLAIMLQPVLDPRPDVTCARKGGPTSGYYDGDKKCAISIASSKKIAAWDSKPKPMRIIGSVLILVGLIDLVVVLVRSRRAGTPPRAG